MSTPQYIKPDESKSQMLDRLSTQQPSDITPMEGMNIAETRQWKMFQLYYSGVSEEQIAVQFSMPIGIVRDSIRSAVNRAMNEQLIGDMQGLLVNQLVDIDREYQELYKDLPNMGELSHEETAKVGGGMHEPASYDIVELKEQVCNIPEKRRLLDSRRATALAIKAVAITKRDKRKDTNDRDQADEIMEALGNAVGQVVDRLVQQSEKVGEQKEKLRQSSDQVIDLELEESYENSDDGSNGTGD